MTDFILSAFGGTGKSSGTGGWLVLNDQQRASTTPRMVPGAVPGPALRGPLGFTLESPAAAPARPSRG